MEKTIDPKLADIIDDSIAEIEYALDREDAKGAKEYVENLMLAFAAYNAKEDNWDAALTYLNAYSDIRKDDFTDEHVLDLAAAIIVTNEAAKHID